MKAGSWIDALGSRANNNTNSRAVRRKWSVNYKIISQMAGGVLLRGAHIGPSAKSASSIKSKAAFLGPTLSGLFADVIAFSIIYDAHSYWRALIN